MMLPRLVAAPVALLLAFGWTPSSPAHVPNTAPLTEAQRAWISTHPIVRYTTVNDWSPLVEMQRGQAVGLLAAYLKHFESSTGLRFEYVPSASWSEAVALLEAGDVDMLPGASHIQLEGLAEPPLLSRTFLSGSLILIGRADEGVAFSLRDLAHKRVAMQARERHTLPADQLQRLQIVQTRSVDETLAAVAEGRADYLIGMEAIHPAFVRSRFIGKLGMAGTLDIPPMEVRAAVRADQHALLGILDWAIGQLSNEETDLIFEQVASELPYGAPTAHSLWRYRTREILLLLLLLAGLATAVAMSLQARRLAQRNVQVKARFLATMSHEIRTPINVIVGSLEALQRQAFQSTTQRLVDTMGYASNTLVDLLDNVLDLSKLEAGKVTLDRVAADPAELLRDVARLMILRAETKGLQLEVVLNALPVQTLQLDTIRLRQVLSNLVGNAVKFTESGAITVHALRETFDARTWLRVDVHDTGPGIAVSDQAALFSPYVQADSSSTRSFGGTGLGLAICRELIELMGGTIWLNSMPGVGTQVSFRIPWVPSPTPLPAPQPRRHAETDEVPLRHLHVLVCDDNTLNREVIAQQLEALGAHVAMVAGGNEALAYLREKSVDLLLLDCHMPGIDGYETAQRVRQEIDGQLPIFAVSAASDAAHLQRCVEVEMSAVLRKPIRSRELLGLLVLWDLAEQSQERTTTTPCDLLPADISPLPYLVQDLQDAQRSAAEGDTKKACHHLHRITGSAAMFGMPEIERESRQLEEHARSTGVVGDLATLDGLIRMQTTP